MIPASRRASAYGVFTGVFGIAWFAGSAIEGGLYDVSVTVMVTVAVVAQLAALVPIVIAARLARR